MKKEKQNPECDKKPKKHFPVFMGNCDEPW
jgi:hypothetical protein